MNSIFSDYLRIINKEFDMEIRGGRDKCLVELQDPDLVLGISRRMLEIARNSTVLRFGNRAGHLTQDKIAYESDGAHTNLVMALVDCVLDMIYGWGNNPPNYDRREITEAVRMHDLPENETGDTPDNLSRDETQKLNEDFHYFEDFLNLHPKHDSSHTHYVKKLLGEMEYRTSEEGRIIYLADKLAAIIMMLYYDQAGLYPYALENDPNISEINRVEMKLCELHFGKGYLLSEMWSIDFVFARELVKFDDTGFFTAVLVMTTLLVHNKWYAWREEQYEH